MNVSEGKDLVFEGICRDFGTDFPPELFDPHSPDGDPGKFTIAGKVARIIHRFNGWNININPSWFIGSYDEPVINRRPFHFYAFAIPHLGRHRNDHYLICDYLNVRDWVLDFAAPKGYDHRDHSTWRADLPLYSDEQHGYFRWGDEPVGVFDNPGRVFQVDNIATVAISAGPGQHIGTFGVGGESAAHRLLKLYVADHATEFGLSAAATPHIEYPFVTGDRVDVMFENHLPDRTVVEVEVEGEQNICVGIHQAIKYRSLAEADGNYPLHGGRVGSLVVAYSTDYPRALELSQRYEVPLLSVDRERVLAAAV